MDGEIVWVLAWRISVYEEQCLRVKKKSFGGFVEEEKFPVVFLQSRRRFTSFFLFKNPFPFEH